LIATYLYRAWMY